MHCLWIPKQGMPSNLTVKDIYKLSQKQIIVKKSLLGTKSGI